MTFEVKKIEVDGRLCLKFSGQIDEEAVFPTGEALSGEVTIDLDQVSSINSVGIRAWIQWFNIFSDVKFVFENCHNSLVMQMNMVEGFLPEGSEVRSLYVPFYCESSDEEREYLFTVGKEILVEDGRVRLDYEKDKICGPGCDPEIDVNEVKFFRFLLDDAEQAA